MAVKASSLKTGGVDWRLDVLSRHPSQPLYTRLGLGESDSGYKDDCLISLCLGRQVLTSMLVADSYADALCGPVVGLSRLPAGLLSSYAPVTLTRKSCGVIPSSHSKDQILRTRVA